MAVYLSPVGGVAAQFFDNNGTPLAGGLIYTYAAGTSTPATTYTSSSGIIAHSNPIVLDASGRVPTGEIWLSDVLAYKFVIKTAQDVLIASYDNISGINSNFVAYTAQQEIQTATAGQTLFTLTTMTYQPGTNNLAVYVDGVNQYGPGAQYAYVETSSTEITFVSGLHEGASVKFTTAAQVASAVVNAENVAYDPPFFGAVGTNVEAKLAQTVSVKDFGAVGDGVTDDTQAIQNAIAAFTPSSPTPYVATDATTIYVPNGNYLISEVIVIPEHVNLVGDGKAATVFTCADASSGIAFGTRATDCRGSHSGGFTIDGDGVATTLLYIGLCVERSFSDIVATNGAGVGILVEAAQNNLFTNINSSYNSINLQLDYGAGNNTFIRCEIDSASTHNLYVTQTGASPSGAFTQPTYNVFDTCIFERTDGTSQDGGFYQDAGKFNNFINCNFSCSTDTGGTLIKLRDTYSLGSTASFVNGFISGNATATAFDLNGVASIYCYGIQIFENFSKAFILGDSCLAEVERSSYGGVTTIFANQSGGVKGIDELLKTSSQQFSTQILRPNASDAAFNIGVSGDSYSRLKISAGGTIDAGPGNTGQDVSIFRSSSGGVMGWNATGPFKISNAGAVMSGTGVPTIGLPNGSIFMRTDGSGTNDNLYVRRGGAWVGIA